MKNFQFIPPLIDVFPLLVEIKQNSDLWDDNPERRTTKGTSHSEMKDIWIRYNDKKNYDANNPSKFVAQHFPVWYPAWYKLPSLRPIVMGLMRRLEGTHLGGILITKIPPGGVIHPHADKGWHPEFYKTKIYVVLESNPQCANYCGGDSVVMAPGEAWYFDNTVTHSVVNEGISDRITLIVSMRCE